VALTKDQLEGLFDNLKDSLSGEQHDEFSEIIKKFEKTLNDSSKSIKEQIEAYDKLRDKIRETGDAARSFENALERSIKTFTGVTTSSNSLVGSFFKLREETGNSEKAFKKAKDTFTKTFTALNVGVSIMDKVVQSTIAMAVANDQALASFNKTTGAAGHYNKELYQLEKSNRRLGISTAEIGESYQALMGGLSGFGTMAQSERERLGELGAQYAKTGISASDFAGSVETMTRGFGMSTTAASGMVEESRQLAQALGRDVGSVVSELNQSLPQLASYGDDAVDIFFDLERQAQRTGLAVSELTSIAGNYRTFDKAAAAAGNLNAVLGTQLFSTMGLLEAQLEGPEAVIEYMSENLANSIGDWNSLNTFQKEATANAANMSVEQMNNLMNQRNMTREERDRITTQKEAMASARSMAEEFKILMAEFAVAIQPTFEIFKHIIGWFSTGLQFLNKWTLGFGGLALIVGGLAVKFVLAAAKVAIMNSSLAARIPILAAIAAKWNAIAMAKARAGEGTGLQGLGPKPANAFGSAGSLMPPRTAGRFAGAGKWLGRAGGVMGVGMGAYNVATSENKGKSLFKGLLGAGAGFVLTGGNPMGAAAGFGIGSSFDNGGGVGGTGPTPATVHGGEAIVPIQRTPAAENLASMVAERSGEHNAAVLAAVNAQTQAIVSALGGIKFDPSIVIGKDKIGKVINTHLGEQGSAPLRLKAT
jgi:ABC-type transporter Mla subunit MlaD